MATDRANDLHAFKSFIDEQLEQGEPLPTLEQALARWEYENSSEAEREESPAAIRLGLTDIDAGCVRPFEEFDLEFRAKHGMAPRS